MIERKTLFRRVFEALIEGRSLQAQRLINEYLKNRAADTAERR